MFEMKKINVNRKNLLRQTAEKKHLPNLFTSISLSKCCDVIE